MRLSLITLLFFVFKISFGQTGCTDPLALNFNVDAMTNDGSCIYPQSTISSVELVNPMPSELMEQSGMINEDSLIWIHLDSGNGNKLFAFESASFDLSHTIEFENIINHDWEDISADENHIYVGDFGNNNGNRTDLRIWKFNKNDLYGLNPSMLLGEIISFSYPEQTDFSDQSNNHNFDCEAMIVYQDQIFLFTKEWVSNTTSIYTIPIESGEYEAQLVGNIDCDGLITGADIDVESNTICLTGYDFSLGITPFVFLLWDFQDLDFTSGNKRRIDLDWLGHQMESIAYNQDNKWYIGSEYYTIGPLEFTNQLREIDLSSFFADPIGITEISEESALFFPNPSSGQISFAPLVQWAEIYNQKGQLVCTFNQRTPFESELKAGCYFVRIKTNNRTIHQQLIIAY